MSQPNIILTGFMGTGKSTVGRLLAKRIGYDFVDTDIMIEQQTGQTIANIFETRGETAFRKLESELVEDLAQKEGLIIATGGGLILDPQNVAKLEKSGKIICLTATPEEILARVSKQQDVRPLLQEKDPRTKIKELLCQRDDVYKQFPQLSTLEQAPEQLIDKLLNLIDSLPSRGAVSP